MNGCYNSSLIKVVRFCWNMLNADLNVALKKRWESHENRPSIQKWADIDTLAESGVSKVMFCKMLLTDNRH